MFCYTTRNTENRVRYEVETDVVSGIVQRQSTASVHVLDAASRLLNIASSFRFSGRCDSDDVDGWRGATTGPSAVCHHPVLVNFGACVLWTRRSRFCIPFFGLA